MVACDKCPLQVDREEVKECLKCKKRVHGKCFGDDKMFCHICYEKYQKEAVELFIEPSHSKKRSSNELARVPGTDRKIGEFFRQQKTSLSLQRFPWSKNGLQEREILSQDGGKKKQKRKKSLSMTRKKME